jgi:KUP system potassium uptake protein
MKKRRKKYDRRDMGDYRFIVGNSYLSYDNALSFWKNLLIKSYYNLKMIGVQEEANFGLDESNVIYEKYPLVYQPQDEYVIRRKPVTSPRPSGRRGFMLTKRSIRKEV